MRWPAALLLLLIVTATGAGGFVLVRRAASRDETAVADAADRAPIPRRRAEAPDDASVSPNAPRVVRGTVRDRDVVDFGHPPRVRIDRGMGAEAPRLFARLPGTTSAWEPPESEDPADDRVTVYGDLPAGPVEIVLRAGDRERTKLVQVAASRTVDCVFE